NKAEITLAMRAWHFDQWTRAFLAVHPESTVLHLGCGLDTRVYRINPGPSVRWFDIDLPHVIALREGLYPEREAYRRIGSSVTDLSWIDAIAGDTPVLVIGLQGGGLAAATIVTTLGSGAANQGAGLQKSLIGQGKRCI